MKVFIRVSSVLLLSGLLLACGEDLTSENHLNNAKTYLEQPDRTSAIIELKNALKIDANNARARALLGKVYFEIGEYQNADKELSKALLAGADATVVVPVLAQVLLGLGEYEKLDKLTIRGLGPQARSVVQAAMGLSMLYQGDLAAAKEIIDTAVQNKPNSAYAQVAAARLLMADKEYDSAREQLDVVFAAYPDYTPAWNLLGDIMSADRQPKEAEKAYSQVIKTSTHSFDARLNRAMMRIYQRNFKGAREDLVALGKRYSQARFHPGVFYAWGIVSLQAKQIDKAEKSFEQASEYSNAYPLTLYYLAAINMERGYTENAQSYIYRFLGMVSDSVVGAKLAARIELEHKDFAKAEQRLLPIVEARPEDLEALNLLASALVSQGKSGEGVELLAKIAELQPDSPEAKARLGAGFLAAGSEDLGIATLRDILVKDPGYEQADILIVLNFLRQKEVEKALEAAKDYRERNPASATSYDLLGRAYLAGGETDQAMAAFKKALELRPGDPGASHSLAEFELLKKDYKAAREYYNEVLRHNPDHMPTLMKVAASYAIEGKEEKMFNSLQSTLLSHPRAMEPRLIQARYYIAKGKLDKAEPLFDELTDEQKAHPDAMVTMAGFELAAGRYNQALSTLAKLIQGRPNVSQYHYMKSRAYAGLGDMENFTSELERTVELAPDHFYAKIALARLALLTNDNVLFEERLAELQKVAPKNPDVMKLTIVSAQKRGDYEYAEKMLKIVFEQAPTTSNAIALAVHYQSIGDTDKAIVQLQHWIEQNPEEVVVRERLAEIYGSDNRQGGVLYQYREILKVDPNHVVALNNLAWYLRDENPQEALKYAERAITLSPESSSILDTLAMVQMKNGNLIEARRSIDRALSLAPDSPEMRFHEAQIAVAEGDKKGAIGTLTSLLEEHAQFSERSQAQAYLNYLK